MKIRPLRGFVLVAIDKDPEQTATGLWLGLTDDTERPKMLRGTVIAVGPGDRKRSGDGRKPMDARVGMRVAVDRKHAFAELEEREPGKPAREVIVVHDSQLAVAC